jgi:hypothetical protein
MTVAATRLGASTCPKARNRSVISYPEYSSLRKSRSRNPGLSTNIEVLLSKEGDGGKSIGLEAGAADERTVDIRLSHKGGGVVCLH